MSAKAEWERHHGLYSNSSTSHDVPSHLYTDENPATTIKGTGFKDQKTAERTISLTSQAGVRYKQYWTIKANRERAVHHPHQTSNMRDAITVFDNWLGKYQPPSLEERKAQEEEWRKYRKLCDSSGNSHAYGKEVTKEQLKQAREDVKHGQERLLQCLQFAQEESRKKMAVVKQSSSCLEVEFPRAAFTALFGGPGVHGYGTHVIDDDETSFVVIKGMDGLLELIPKHRLSLGTKSKSVTVYYDRGREMARAEIECDDQPTTLDSIWSKADMAVDGQSKPYPISARMPHESSKEASWTCATCTYLHRGISKQLFLTCELCGAPSYQTCALPTRTTTLPAKNAPCTSLASASSNSPTVQPVSASSSSITQSKDQPCSSAWGSLRAPSNQDIRGPRKRRKVLEPPPPILDFVIVLDFEWTADDKRKMKHVAEITQFPSVAMQLVDRRQGSPLSVRSFVDQSSLPLPTDLTAAMPRYSTAPQDARAVSIFDSFVRPTLNPTLTAFSIGLTAITQAQVDDAPSIDEVLKLYTQWLASLNLLDEHGNRRANWCFATWGDVDIMTTLRCELQYKSIDLPSYFNHWINLKDDSIFKRHYNRKPQGGLRSCVEFVGATWEGRAHNGLVDSINTAKIVRDMARNGFRFTRPTRGLDRNGVPFGQKTKH